MFRSRLPRLAAAAAVVLAALATAGPPAKAAQSLDGLYAVSDGSLLAVASQVNTTGTRVFAAFLQPISTTKPRGSWSTCEADYASAAFTCTETFVFGGQVIGEAYKAPTSTSPGRHITVDFSLNRMLTSTADLTFSAVELTPGGLTAQTVANTPATGFFVPRIKTDDFPTFGPELLGTGCFLTSQSNMVSLIYLTYHADGSPIWFRMTGAVVAFANIVTLSADFMLAGTTAAGTGWFQSRHNGGHRFDPPGVASMPDYEHWVTRFRSATF